MRQFLPDPRIDARPLFTRARAIVKGRNGLRQHADARLPKRPDDRLQTPLDPLHPGFRLVEQVVDAQADHDQVVLLRLLQPAAAARRVVRPGKAQPQVPKRAVGPQPLGENGVPVLIAVGARADPLGNGVAQIAHAQPNRPVAADHPGKQHVGRALPPLLRPHKRRQERLRMAGNVRAGHGRLQAQILSGLGPHAYRVAEKAFPHRHPLFSRAPKGERDHLLRLVKAIDFGPLHHAQARGVNRPAAQRLVGPAVRSIRKGRVHRVGKQQRIAVFPARKHAVEHPPRPPLLSSRKPALVPAARQRVGMIGLKIDCHGSALVHVDPPSFVLGCSQHSPFCPVCQLLSNRSA